VSERSDQQNYIDDPVGDDGEESANVGTQGLAARMKLRREQLQKQHSKVFDIPGWEGILAVELEVMDYQTSRKISRRHEKQRDPAIQELYTAAEQLIQATVRFHEVDAQTGKLKDTDGTWKTFAQLAAQGTGDRLPEDLSSRQALIFLDVTQLAHDAVMLKIPVDTGRLFDGDRDYELWIGALVDRVYVTRRKQDK
jgi:hypothetical protein